LEQLGLAAAIRQLIQRFRQVHQGKVKLQAHRLENLPQRLSSIVYRLVQECFNNIAKHSFATSVNISVGVADGTLKLTVADNGIGFDVAAAFRKQDSFGLSGIRERVTLLGGTFHIESTRAEAKQARSRKLPGTKIVVELPIPREAIGAETLPNRRTMQEASPGLVVAG
jgi:two-component system sensor histidine kinase DegS